MEIKIIGKSVVPDKITLYENDLGAKHLVFSSNRINDGVNLDKLSAYLEIEREEGVSDRFILDKTVNGDTLYFTLPINLALTETADLISAQLVFENDEKTLSYRSKVFYIDVKNSVDGVSSYEQVAPTVLNQLESKMEKAVENCTQIKSDIEFYKEDFENNIEETSSKIKDEVLAQVSESSVDDALSTESINPVQNKVVTEELNNCLKVLKGNGIPTTETVGELGQFYIDTTTGETYQYKPTSESDNKPWKIMVNASNFSDGYGIRLSNTNKITFIDAPSKYFDDRNTPLIAVTCNRINYAVMKGLTEPTVGSGPVEWTDEQKAAARQTIGATKLYKHTISLINTEGYSAKIHFYSLNNESDYLTRGKYSDGLLYIYLKPKKIISKPYLLINTGNFMGGVLFKSELFGEYDDNGDVYPVISITYSGITVTDISEVIEEV